MYWATLSHSREVLEVLCALAQQEGCIIDVSIPDHSNSTPLDVAVASQQWDMVKLLVQNGGLKVCKFVYLRSSVSVHAQPQCECSCGVIVAS